MAITLNELVARAQETKQIQVQEVESTNRETGETRNYVQARLGEWVKTRNGSSFELNGKAAAKIVDNQPTMEAMREALSKLQDECPELKAIPVKVGKPYKFTF